MLLSFLRSVRERNEMKKGVFEGFSLRRESEGNEWTNVLEFHLRKEGKEMEGENSFIFFRFLSSHFGMIGREKR